METTITAISLFVVPLAFNILFALLAKFFEYPDVLRQPTSAVLEKFQLGGQKLLLTWWFFMLTAVLFAPVSVVVQLKLQTEHNALTATGLVFGILASLVQFLGLVRWTFLVPYLARESQKQIDKTWEIDFVFQSFNRLLGVAIGEHLGYMFTGFWTICVSASLLLEPHNSYPLGISGGIIGLVLLICSLEFVGPNEESGWDLAAFLTPITYVAWSIWLMAIGAYFLVSL